MSTELPVLSDAGPRSADGIFPGRWWHRDDDRIVCDLCPRECSLKDGDRGFCFVRQNLGGKMQLTTYGRSTGFCIDPIEKKPLNHFYPGTSVLSFGTAGCNLGCKFCQNWDISKAREVERLSHRAFPEEIALAASSLNCHSVAYTYNDPIIWAEYAIDTARACRDHGIRNVAVTAGYISECARDEFYQFMDAANVDLKAFTEDFYYRITYSHLQPVLDTLRWLKHDTDVWFEITNLIIPDANDQPDELQRMCDWILDAVGPDVPVHFSAFHPDFRMTDRPATPHSTLVTARDIALRTGLHHVYVGNVDDVQRQSTFCPGCRRLVIERNWYALGIYDLVGNQCRHCGTTISGHFADSPGDWGRKRQPVDMRRFHIAGLSGDASPPSTTFPPQTAAGTGGSAPVSVIDPNLPVGGSSGSSTVSVPHTTTAAGSTTDADRSTSVGEMAGGPSLTNARSDQTRSGTPMTTPGDATSRSQNKDELKLDDSALAWLASQPSESKESAAPAKADTPAPKLNAAQPALTQTSNTQPVAADGTAGPPTRMPLTAGQRTAITLAAGELVRAATEDRSASIPDLNQLGIANAAVSGIFVSLKRDGRLRSCMGSFGGTMPLLRTLVESSRRTATADPRFPKIAPCELPYLDMEVWLLFAPERVDVPAADRASAIKVGTHGLQIIRGNQRGLLLPGVATDNHWNEVEFLDNVCIKAGLSPTDWKSPDTTLYRFEGNCLKGGLFDAGTNPVAQTPLIYSDAELSELGRVVRDNVVAIVRGATPLYYCGTVPDATVNTIILTATLPGGQELKSARVSIRDEMPLQSTAFSMCEELAAALRRRGSLNANYQVDLAIGWGASMHGSVDRPALEGIDPQRRVMLVAERTRSAWLYDRTLSVEELLAQASELCQVREPVYAQIYSLAFQSTSDRVAHAALPKPQRGQSDRPAAVAGRFYPGDPAEMNRQLDELLAGDATPEPCRAVMVPHAGWMYSGRLAASVLKRTRIPKTVIVIGPKHTPHGTDWSVAPHHNWQLPGMTIPSDYELAMKLADRIDGLEPDAAAHHSEHAIEVELPLIARLAPGAKVVGIAIGGCNLASCERFAEQFAGVLRELDEPPLLVISSDMNHFANETETHRLDAMALAELDRLDEDSLYHTCRNNHISMCGMLPAVIVLKTLKKLAPLHQSRNIGYATSADVTNDSTRVVGYAGRIFQ